MTTTTTKGHWPAGKRRSTIDPRTAASIQRWLARVYAGDEPGLSLRGIARAIRVSDRQVRHWASGEHWPSPRHVGMLTRMRDGDARLRAAAQRLPSGGRRR